jgi:hypothetical protein
MQPTIHRKGLIAAFRQNWGLELSQQHTTQLLQPFIDMGLITRTVTPKRYNIYSITLQGKVWLMQQEKAIRKRIVNKASWIAYRNQWLEAYHAKKNSQ